MALVTRLTTLPLLALLANCPVAAEFFVAAGGSYHQVSLTPSYLPYNDGERTTSPHLGVGISRPFSTDSHHYLGMQFEYDQADGYDLLSWRAAEYRYEFAPRWHLGAFAGGAILDTGEGNMGYYVGATSRYDLPWANTSIHLDYTYADKLGRDSLGSDDIGNGEITNFFYDVTSFKLYFSWRPF